MILGIAIWISFPNGEVLLKQNIYQGKKQNICYYQPIKGWVANRESVKEAIRRLMQENIEVNFESLKLHFKEIKREYFSIIGKGLAVRYHFLVQLPFEINIKTNTVRLIGFQDLPKIKKMSQKRKDLEKDIIVFDEDYQVLLEIFGIEREADLTFFYFSKLQFLFVQSILPFLVSTKNEPHFGQILPVGLFHKAKSQSGHLEQP